MSNSRASLASDYLDNFYASLPPRPSNDALMKLHRPSSCKPTRRTNSSLSGELPAPVVSSPWASGSGQPPSRSTSRPTSSLRRAASTNDLSRPSSSLPTMGRSSSSSNLSRPRSSLRREYNNTHRINGFYQAPDNLADEYYSHGSWYKNPEESPFAGLNGGTGKRFFKSDVYSFFNGQHHTVRQPERVGQSRPSTSHGGRAQFEPPKVEPVDINSKYLEPIRRKEAIENVSLGDRISHHFLPPPPQSAITQN